jgi:hypothetical protein
MAEREFSSDRVIRETLKVYRSLADAAVIRKSV